MLSLQNDQTLNRLLTFVLLCEGNGILLWLQTLQCDGALLLGLRDIHQTGVLASFTNISVPAISANAWNSLGCLSRHGWHRLPGLWVYLRGVASPLEGRLKVSVTLLKVHFQIIINF